VIQVHTQAISDSVRDTAVVHTPLPGGVGVMVRYLFNLPSWFQIGGAIVGVLVAAGVLWHLWKRRLDIWSWLTTRSRGVKIALASVTAAVVIGLAAFGAASWHYVMHNNDFCVSCHVMTTAFARFQHSEHRKLQCHDCHQQSLYASMRQMVLWVAEKPLEIPPHAKVPNKVCGECHIQKPGQDSVWKRIIATAGHRIHLNSDSASLKNMQCTKCHGLEIHHFAPVDATCGQSGCHQNVQIRFAKMSNQTSLHCVQCHQFTSRVSETISRDSTRKFLVPNANECLGCHAMQKRMGGYDEAKDPHQGVCGVCHDPHKQASPAVAWTTCQNSGCHANAATLTPFHRGIAAAALDKCERCHQAHTWRVSGDKCLVCHKTIFEDRPPGVRGKAGLTPARLTSMGAQGATTTGYTGAETFSHRRHKDQECVSCHGTGKEHGALKVRTVADCQNCHHAAATASADGAVSGTPARRCTSCHAGVGLRQGIADTIAIKLTVWKAPRERVLTFRHDRHAFSGCLVCHGTPGTLAVPASKNCASCHDQHHEPDVQCRACHTATPKDAHTREAHLGCASAQCHAPQTVANLRPKRNVCVVCHQNKATHKPGKECAACHQVEWLTAQKGS
jgi:nitrate/TMAO reductase-like tetraheme cytochrome c subunit